PAEADGGAGKSDAVGKVGHAPADRTGRRSGTRVKLEIKRRRRAGCNGHTAGPGDVPVPGGSNTGTAGGNVAERVRSRGVCHGRTTAGADGSSGYSRSGRPVCHVTGNRSHRGVWSKEFGHAADVNRRAGKAQPQPFGQSAQQILVTIK